jgi:hypothetical protein
MRTNKKKGFPRTKKVFFPIESWAAEALRVGGRVMARKERSVSAVAVIGTDLETCSTGAVRTCAT